MKKVLIAVFAVLAAASTAKAQDISVNFDGGASSAVSFAGLLQKPDSRQNDNIAYATPVLADARTEAVGGVKVVVSMKAGTEEKKETLLCQSGPGKKELRDCKKQSDSLFLTEKDIDGMALRRFFPSGNPGEFSPAQTRHAYCNQSGPEYFNCVDKHVDPNWIAKGKRTKYTTQCGSKVASSYSGYPTISGEIGCTYTTEEEIEYANEPYWTHECEKVDNC